MPHLHYLTAKTPAETIRDFKKSSLVFHAVYILISLVFAGTVYFAEDALEMEIVIPLFIVLILAFGISILPKIYETAKLLNEKGIMDIAPSLLFSLQFILNLTLTSVIIPIFLWSKCSEIEKRRQPLN